MCLEAFGSDRGWRPRAVAGRPSLQSVAGRGEGGEIDGRRLSREAYEWAWLGLLVCLGFLVCGSVACSVSEVVVKTSVLR